jgi:cytochrome c peroxidase
MVKGIAIAIIAGICLLAVRQVPTSAPTVATGPGPVPYPLIIPPGFPSTKLFDHNPRTLEGFQLGRALFYDGRLSRDGNFSCASCHQPFAAFSTYDHTFSHGFHDQFTTRNAPALFNLAWVTSFDWDGGINHLEVQPLSPLGAPNEMASSLQEALVRVQADTAYHRMFKEAFGTDSINSERLLKALAQFTGSLVSAGSKYDLYRQGKATFNSIELSGYAIYQQKCANCHPEPLFTDGSYRNNGLSLNSEGDVGRMRITGAGEDSLKFKVPSLRNLLLTAPYMHDGRFVNLHQVLDHYTKGILKGPTLDPVLKKGISLTPSQQEDLLVFLSDLTDYGFTRDPRFGPPLK